MSALLVRLDILVILVRLVILVMLVGLVRLVRIVAMSGLYGGEESVEPFVVVELPTRVM